MSRGHKGTTRRKPVEGMPGYFHCRGVVCQGAPRHARSFGLGKPRYGRLRDWEICIRCFAMVQKECQMRYYLRNRQKNLERHWRDYEPFAWGKGEHRGMVRIDSVRPVLNHLRSEMTVKEIASSIDCSESSIFAWVDAKQARFHKKYAVAIVKLAYERRIQSSRKSVESR